MRELCTTAGCRKVRDHTGSHDRQPKEVFNFLSQQDLNKLNKAGYATPRGGRKGGYQNHVLRNNRVIIPYERVEDVDLSQFKDGYVVRLLPEQYFGPEGQPKEEFLGKDASIRVGVDAFVLYRSHQSYEQWPPPEHWEVRHLVQGGSEVGSRGSLAEDRGHYLLRLPQAGEAYPKADEGPPQGIFAPEYADEETNYECKCVLAWLIVRTQGCPYVEAQAQHLLAVLDDAGLRDEAIYHDKGALRRALTSCPLCLKIINYEELHETISFEEEVALANAGMQSGATRSTQANLFHLLPLLYGALQHRPDVVAWGHATCNTRLGQRRCYSLPEVLRDGMKVAIVRGDGGTETFGWISPDYSMIRSPFGAVWAQIADDWSDEPLVEGNRG